MTSLGNCDANACRSIKLLFKLLLKDAFTTRSNFSAPRHSIQVRDLAFIPHLLNIAVHWRRIPLQMVCQSLQLAEVVWNRCLSSPYFLDRNRARLREVGMLFLDHRIQIKASPPDKTTNTPFLEPR